ncbi:MAG: DNA polymerase III subunit delta [Phycisphaerae bacterium]
MPTAAFAIIGEDPFLQAQALADILAKLPPDAERIDLDGERAELSDVFDELRGFSMFGGHKLVVVREADAFLTRHREHVEAYLDSPVDSGTLVLRAKTLPSNTRVYKAIKKVGDAIKVEPPKAEQLPGWIQNRAAKCHSLRLKPDAAEALADLVGADLGRLDNELAKLALQVEGVVTIDDVTGSVAFQRDQQMWSLTDELSGGRAAPAVRRWRQLCQTDPSSEFRAVTWLGLWLEKVAGAGRMHAEGARPFDIAKQLKIWPAKNVDGVLASAKKLGPAGLAAALDQLAEIDRRNKSGLGDPARNVEAFILNVCR